MCTHGPPNDGTPPSKDHAVTCGIPEVELIVGPYKLAYDIWEHSTNIF